MNKRPLPVFPPRPACLDRPLPAVKPAPVRPVGALSGLRRPSRSGAGRAATTSDSSECSPVSPVVPEAAINRAVEDRDLELHSSVTILGSPEEPARLVMVRLGPTTTVLDALIRTEAAAETVDALGPIPTEDIDRRYWAWTALESWTPVAPGSPEAAEVVSIVSDLLVEMGFSSDVQIVIDGFQLDTIMERLEIIGAEQAADGAVPSARAPLHALERYLGTRLPPDEINRLSGAA